MKNGKSNDIRNKTLDFLSIIFIGYFIFYLFYAFLNINLKTDIHSSLDIILLIDIIPSAFAIVWLMLRYQHNMQPFLNYMYTNRRVIMPILGILAIAAQILKFSVMH